MLDMRREKCCILRGKISDVNKEIAGMFTMQISYLTSDISYL